MRIDLLCSLKHNLDAKMTIRCHGLSNKAAAIINKMHGQCHVSPNYANANLMRMGVFLDVDQSFAENANNGELSIQGKWSGLTFFCKVNRETRAASQ